MRSRPKALGILLMTTLWLAAAPAVSAVDLTRAQAGRISQWVGQILEQAHYRHAVLDDTVSASFLKNYLDALDYSHMVFLQSDVDEFTKRYGKSLDEYTLRGDASPGYEIFERYLQRLTSCNQLAQRLLKESYDFSADESFLVKRDKAPWPKDAAELEQLWKLRIKFELLQDRLTFLDKSTKKEKGKAADAGKKPAEPAPKEPGKYNPEETLKTISKRYDRLLRNMQKLKSEDILQTYLTSLSHSFDPHSDYMSPTEAEEFDIKSIKLSLIGIGATLQSDDGYTKIVSLVPGMPADLSKQLKPGDKITAVAQADGDFVDVIEMPVKDVVQLIRGAKGTAVRLMVIPTDSPGGAEKKIVRIIRDEIKLTEQFAKARVVEMPVEGGPAQRLGVVNLPQFYEHCARDVEKLLERLKQEKVDGVILDLRRNGGGILEEAVSLTGLFIGKGPVVQVREKDPRRRAQVYRDDHPKAAYDGPLVVLVSHLSASASEITAAALQDYGRAVVVGDQTTHGKGTVQKLLSLKSFIDPDFGIDPGKLKLTVAKFYRVAGTTTQKIGVTPDVVLPSRFDYMELGEASLPNCLPADTTAPVPFTRTDRVGNAMEDIRAKSSARTRNNPEFVYIGQDIELLKKQIADKSVSLNEAKRLKEREEQKKRDEERRQERAQRKAGPERVFEMSLAMIDDNKPLKLLTTPRGKDDNTLTASTSPTPKATDPAGDDDELDEPDHKLDPHLDESLKILADLVRVSRATVSASSTNR